jgi:hypothetical protein
MLKTSELVLPLPNQLLADENATNVPVDQTTRNGVLPNQELEITVKFEAELNNKEFLIMR